ncbi:unnamed protein product [Trichobilharzia regenti]|nr:unnamed protein product [Trichobilharzia regenti]
MKKTGRLVYLKGTEKEGQTLMVIDHLSNGSFYERILASVRLDKDEVEEAERGEESDGGKGEGSGGEKEVEGPLKEIEETLTPIPVRPP